MLIGLRGNAVSHLMAGIEFLTPEGLRVDGRRAHEIRKLQCKIGVSRQADGSAYVEQGNTKAIASVYGPHEVSSLFIKLR
jgi:exosome complex component RRP41